MAAVRYLVDDVDKALAFYTGHLDFTVVEAFGSTFAAVAKGDLILWLSGPKTSAARPMPDGRVPEPGGWNRVVIEVDDLAGRVTTMRASGVQFRNAIVSGPGGKQILAEDGCGNVVELFERA
jgi:catechol 2,3-dioxygenase-like lactoylglutathione lyase family enzyme